MSPVVIRPATFSDAKAIDAFVAALDPLRRDLNGWVNQAELEIAAVDCNEVVGFAARTKHHEHPTRDLVTVFAMRHTYERDIVDALFAAIPAKRPLKMRLPADDVDATAQAVARGFVERIRSAMFLVDARDLLGPTTATEIDLNRVPNDVFEAFNALYRNTHAWDPPQDFSRRYIRRTLLAGARHIAVIRDDDARIVGLGAAHAVEDDSVAADITLAGAVDPSRADALAVTRMVVAKLALPYADDGRPLWFEVDHGYDTNTPLATVIDETGARAHDEIAVFTTD